jgi:hypothetical protein
VLGENETSDGDQGISTLFLGIVGRGPPFYLVLWSGRKLSRANDRLIASIAGSVEKYVKKHRKEEESKLSTNNQSVPRSTAQERASPLQEDW